MYMCLYSCRQIYFCLIIPCTSAVRLFELYHVYISKSTELTKYRNVLFLML